MLYKILYTFITHLSFIISEYQADHLGDKNKSLGNTRSLVGFMNEAILCRMVNGFSDRKITHNQNKAKESGHTGSLADVLTIRDYDTSEHKGSIA